MERRAHDDEQEKELYAREYSEPLNLSWIVFAESPFSQKEKRERKPGDSHQFEEPAARVIRYRKGTRSENIFTPSKKVDKLGHHECEGEEDDRTESDSNLGQSERESP